MSTSTLPSSAPGIAIKELLRGAPESALRKVIRPSIVDTVCELDSDLSSGRSLGELAARLIDPAEALRDPQIRKHIIRMLPLPKAQELAKRLEVKHDRMLYENLCTKAAERNKLKVLDSFFGVPSEPRALGRTISDIKCVQADYALFSHQRSAAARVIDALAVDPRKVVLHMPTGSGKTRTAMHVVAEHLRRHKHTVVCWLAQSTELLDQAADEFEKAWRYLGNREIDMIRFWGSREPNVLDTRDGFIVAGLSKISALNNRDLTILPQLADRVSLTIIDEAHQAIAPTYAAVLTALHSKRPQNALLGLTATPGRSWSDRDEDRNLSDFFESRKVTLDVEGYEDPISYLFDQKCLARPVFRTLNSNAGIKLSADDVKELSDAIDVPQKILKHLGLDVQRNLKIIAEIENLMERHRRIIVFAPSLENARLLTAILSLRGHEIFFIAGDSSPLERGRVVKRFRSNEDGPMVIVNYGVLTTGFDAPATSAAIIARPTRSLVLYSQMVGRATRGTQVGGNDEAEIVTVVDPHLPGFGDIVDAFRNWEDVWGE